MRFDIADLELFLCVVNAGSITQGAARAHLALASASERLRNIEADAGVVLLQRHSRGVSTTEAGEALAHHARLILQQQTRLKQELKDFALGARGTLHLYANTAALIEFLPSRLAPWLAKRPNLRVELKERTSQEIVHAVANARVEGGIVSSAVSPENTHQIPVAKDHLVLIVPKTHALAQCRQLCLADILNQSFVGLSAEHALQSHLDDQARAAGQALAVRIRMKTFEGLCEMVAHGIGIGILPQSIARRYQRRYGYCSVALADHWARRELCLCFRDWETLSLPMQSLFTHLTPASSDRTAAAIDRRAPHSPASLHDD